ncbi:hypothetical protein KSP39_PZI001331 [Platanthera zijinensis]|uniref:Ricin B-like lectin R40G3 n=1 Tax=Platanthera zijinensis TaxID=2320716 RepID=A0AAP0C3B9_9ASPA
MSIFHRHHHGDDSHEKSPANPPPQHIPFDGKTIANPTVRIFTKAEENYSVTIRDGHVVLAPANPRDEFQHWYKDFRWGTEVKDQEGLPAFALVNKATGLAIKHSLGQSHPVRLIPFNPGFLDESILWTESHDTGEDFRCIRMVNNIQLNFDAFHGDKEHGGVHDGTGVVLWEWAKGNNQRWKIVPYYCKFFLLLRFLVFFFKSFLL